MINLVKKKIFIKLVRLYQIEVLQYSNTDKFSRKLAWSDNCDDHLKYLK